MQHPAIFSPLSFQVDGNSYVEKNLECGSASVSFKVSIPLISRLFGFVRAEFQDHFYRDCKNILSDAAFLECFSVPSRYKWMRISVSRMFFILP